MPGMLCSVHDPADAATARRWRQGLALLAEGTGHAIEQFSEPGFNLACVYHPAVCGGGRLLVGDRHVLAVYGSLHDDDLAGLQGEALCRELLSRFVASGCGGLEDLNGRYDVVVWDRQARTLDFISDRFGANRHYLLQRPDSLHLGCEIKALVPHLASIEVDPASLLSMLSFGYHLGDLTLLKSVRRLPNACRLTCREGGAEVGVTRYWDYPYGEGAPLDLPEAELADMLHGRLMQALLRQLRGVGRVLLPISGGLDSRTLAGLLAQSGYSGEVLAYSYGKPGSRDVRYGRAIARRLGYRHVVIPTPADYITRHAESSAWRFDAEWSAELDWSVRHAHTHPVLGDTAGCAVLSGLYGDIMLGSDMFGYQRRGGALPRPVEDLRSLFLETHVEYQPPEIAAACLDEACREEAVARIHGMLDECLAPYAGQPPFYALMRAEFVHRQRRHTAMVAQAIEYSRPALTPFLDRDVADFSMRIPHDLFYDRRLYLSMITTHLPDVAAIPYASTGLPLSPAPFRRALHWRWERGLRHWPALRRWLAKRDAFFSFHDGVLAQRDFFERCADALQGLSPPLESASASARYRALVEGRAGPADQACAFLPPALYVQALKRG